MSGWPSGLRRQTQVLVFERGRGSDEYCDILVWIHFLFLVSVSPLEEDSFFFGKRLFCIMKKVYSSEKSDRYINRHIVSDDRRKFQTIDYLKETFHDELANILSGLSRY
ncbi:unnamed protein product [Brassica rapa]|uniref:Uncharacterized protein n=1 Tax=Brassica campestris TaxID=3711 RepID=A0A8D9G4X7_BRACM|nr:unnamed protein product [Brassica rapa]